MAIVARRLQKELQKMQHSSNPLVHVRQPNDLSMWLVDIRCGEGSVFSGEVFTLRFRFDAQYPIEAPEVVFVNTPPMHEHVYSNGHICLSILYDQWSPAMSVESVCISIISMLASAKRKGRPPDDHEYTSRWRGTSPKKTSWWFHDERC